jgi:hypothetical protein
MTLRRSVVSISAGGYPAAQNWANRILKRICGLLILLVVSHLVLSLAGIPSFYQRVTTGTVPTLIIAGEPRVSNALVAKWAAQRDMTLQTYAFYTIALNLFITLGFSNIAALILWKARREWFHWFTALVLLFYPTSGLWEFTMVSRIAYGYVAASGVLWPIFLLFLYLFPNGQAFPRWTRWIMGGIALLHLAFQSINLATIYGVGVNQFLLAMLSVFPLILGAGFLLILFSQIYRYVRVSTRAEQAQIKWFVTGVALMIFLSALIGWVTSTSDNQAVNETGLGGDLNQLLMLILPVAIGIGILRYRLYDIDLIIRRTLVYALLTAALAVTYFVSVIAIQQLIHPLTGETGRSPVIIVISTLATVALFAPLRRRIQRQVDRRFYRPRYDAEETVQAFSNLLREEVNLEQLGGYLLSAVQETVQPQQIALWLREVNTSTTEPGKGNPPASA